VAVDDLREMLDRTTAALGNLVNGDAGALVGQASSFGEAFVLLTQPARG
jgi:hypothetical protein